MSDALVREGVVGARAEADYFGVLATTRSEVLPSGDYLRSALADATTRITFSPVQSGFASLLLELTTGTTSFMWSEGTIALRNLTTSEELWNYGWDSVGSGLFGARTPTARTSSEASCLARHSWSTRLSSRRTSIS